MMRTCDRCGVVDDMPNMYYVTTARGVECVCNVCASGYSATVVSAIADALGGRPDLPAATEGGGDVH